MPVVDHGKVSAGLSSSASRWGSVLASPHQVAASACLSRVESRLKERNSPPRSPLEIIIIPHDNKLVLSKLFLSHRVVENGLMDMTLDFESSGLGSNPGGEYASAWISCGLVTASA